MQRVVGVDAGGSRVTAVVSTAYGAEWFGHADSANIRTVGLERAVDAIASAVERTGLGAPPSAIAVGAAGVGNATAATALRRALERRFPGTRIAVYEDAVIALRAGVPTGDALALIAGTGSVAYAEIGAERFRVGGYGYLVGDEGAGFSIGSAAVRLLLRSYDGRAPHDAFLQAAALMLGVSNAQETIARIYDAQRPVSELATLAPLTIAHAGAGERSAAKIVQAAALELFELIKALVRCTGIETRALPLLFAGGLLAENTLLTYLLETRVSNELPNLIPLKQAPAPCLGALALARALVQES